MSTYEVEVAVRGIGTEACHYLYYSIEADSDDEAAHIALGSARVEYDSDVDVIINSVKCVY